MLTERNELWHSFPGNMQLHWAQSRLKRYTVDTEVLLWALRLPVLIYCETQNATIHIYRRKRVIVLSVITVINPRTGITNENDGF